MIEDFCICEGPRFVLTISAANPEGGRESGPTVRCCLSHLVAAKVVGNDLQERDPSLAIAFEIHPVEAN